MGSFQKYAVVKAKSACCLGQLRQAGKALPFGSGNSMAVQPSGVGACTETQT